MDIAIITGASSGLGREYARLLDEHGLDEIWLIARREKRLQELEAELKTAVRLLPLDLTQPDAFAKIRRQLTGRQDLEIRWLINAAGFGRIGSYVEVGTEALPMIDLNCRAAVALTQLALPFMSAGSRILEICSCAAFQPIPYLAAYAATKAFLLSYSRALAAELEPQGIAVTAVCPYWIKDTEFIHEARRTDRSHIFKGFPLASTQREVAERSLRAARNGNGVCTPDLMSFLHRLLTSLVPHHLLMQLSRFYRQLG